MPVSVEMLGNSTEPTVWVEVEAVAVTKNWVKYLTVSEGY